MGCSVQEMYCDGHRDMPPGSAFKAPQLLGGLAAGALSCQPLPGLPQEPLAHSVQPEGGPNSPTDLDGNMRAGPFHSNGGQP